MDKTINITLKVWRQRGPKEAGKFETYKLNNVSTDSSFLEMLDILNEQLVNEDKEPVVFDNDCREGICGMCSLYINGHPHGPDSEITTCQLHMRRFKDGDTTVTTTITVIGLEPDSTTENSYSPIYLQNYYPEATRLNNRYRGPAESYKHDSTNQALYENIIALYAIFTNIERGFNELIERIEGNDNIKSATLNTTNWMNDAVQSWINDPRFTTGTYQPQI